MNTCTHQHLTSPYKQWTPSETDQNTSATCDYDMQVWLDLFTTRRGVHITTFRQEIPGFPLVLGPKMLNSICCCSGHFYHVSCIHRERQIKMMTRKNYLNESTEPLRKRRFTTFPWADVCTCIQIKTCNGLTTHFWKAPKTIAILQEGPVPAEEVLWTSHYKLIMCQYSFSYITL